IRGATSGISANGTITIDNSGTIETLSGAAGYGIRAGTGSTITNNLGGIIRQAGTGGMYTISASDTLTLVNAGTISNASTA
ncbi:hypothetical protein GY663_31635, partial [Klebsiella michiganensis]|nr:hypothetical protein [Klebsiella michiganensis]